MAVAFSLRISFGRAEVGGVEKPSYPRRLSLESLRRYYEKYRGDPAYMERMRLRSAKWREENAERNKAIKDEWYERNKERINAEAKAEYVPHPLPVLSQEEKKQRRLDSQRKFRAENRERINAEHRAKWKDPEVKRKWNEARNRRFKENPEFLLRHRLRCRMKHALKGELKAAKTLELIGCSSAAIRLHIEEQWKEGMNWSNLGSGKGTWQIDHIAPIDQHDLSTLEGQRAAFHYSNTQPLWYEDHQRKSATEETGWRRKAACTLAPEAAFSPA